MSVKILLHNASLLSNLVCLLTWLQNMHTTCYHTTHSLHTIPLWPLFFCTPPFITAISVTSLVFLLMSGVFVLLVLPFFHGFDHFAAVWFRFVTRINHPRDCIRSDGECWWTGQATPHRVSLPFFWTIILNWDHKTWRINCIWWYGSAHAWPTPFHKYDRIDVRTFDSCLKNQSKAFRIVWIVIQYHNCNLSAWTNAFIIEHYSHPIVNSTARLAGRMTLKGINVTNIFSCKSDI